MEQGFRTKVAEKYFQNNDTTLADVLKVGDQYAFQIVNNDKPFILKGYKIRVENLVPGNEGSKDKYLEMIMNIGAVYQEYTFAKMACTLNQHFAKPLMIDYAVSLAKDTDSFSYLFIEIIFEYGGQSLDKLEVKGIGEIYNLMRQSANAVSLLHELGIAHLNIQPSKMVYDNKEDTLKLVGLRTSFECQPKNQTLGLEGKVKALGYTAPEVLVGKGLKAIPGEVDTYAWAMSFYSLLLKKSKSDLESEIEMFKKGTEEKYNEFLASLQCELKKANPSIPEEKKEIEIMGEQILEALSYKVESRPVMSDLTTSLRNFERAEDIEIPYAKKEQENISRVVKMLGGDVEIQKLCKSCMLVENSKVMLSCGHKMCRDCILQYMQTKFSKKQYYYKRTTCNICRKLVKLSNLSYIIHSRHYI